LGGKYSDKWHELHLNNPRAVVPQSIMPAYPWLAKNKVDSKDIVAKLELLKWYYGNPRNLHECKYLCLLVVMPYMVSHFLCPYAVIRQIDLAQFVQNHQLRRQSKCQIFLIIVLLILWLLRFLITGCA
jgi:hypothetical protein